MMRLYVVTALVLGLSSLTACSGVSSGSFAPRVPSTSARSLIETLHDFNVPPDAEEPWGGLLAGKNGEYYGTSTDGGAAREGAVYEITAAGKETVLYSFQGAPDGAHPRSTLIVDKKGALYGTTMVGGASNCTYGSYSGCGTVFKLTLGKHGWSESVLYKFQSGNNDGAQPVSGLLMTKSGALLGTTSGGGPQWGKFYRGGVVFQLTPSGSGYNETVIHAFTGPPDGSGPTDALVSDSSGNLYGTTSEGGVIKSHCHKRFGGCGTIFKLTPSGSTYTYSLLYSFKGGKDDGSHPTSSLLLGPKGLFYGLTSSGGGVKPFGQGTVFSVTANGSERMIYRFKGQGGNDGDDPDDTPGLVADASGNMYGTTVAGGSGGARRAIACGGGCGTIFKLAPSKGGFTESVVYGFSGSDGALPYGGVVVDGKGNLLGPTNLGGDLSHCGCGTVFSIAP